MFKASLGVQAPAERGETLSLEALAGELDPARLPAMIRDEWITLWILLSLSLANVVLGIWRPRLRRRQVSTAAGAQTSRVEQGASDASARHSVLDEDGKAREVA